MKEVISEWKDEKRFIIAKKKLVNIRFPKFKNFFLWLSILVIMFLTSCAIVPEWIAPYSPTAMRSDQILLAPSLQHLFGTDYFGRDVFSLVVHGSRPALLIGVCAVLVSSLVGSAIGMIAGYVGGIVDVIVMRIVEMMQSIPGVLLALALAAAMGPSFRNLVIAIAISAVPSYARVMRGQVLSIKNRPFILASRSIGTANSVIFFKHILPHSYSPLLVMASNGLGTAILTSSGLSFLGLGVVSDIPDWGMLLSQGRNYIAAGWWIATFPGLAIALFVLAVNIIGDSLRDYLDPKKRMV
ncbi:ABC transporter permease [Parageobacillus thermoglucosidasius]|uniref:ABC transporter permease n=1 Tax=Parageobacillus thermoglucosidasius TaxID=1426 RepID=A0AB38QXA0_PARTM|nr:ABC transporter permease [Parageobacillus thermoglucosidasius]UOE76114.1 ABC transporter permease [Parageobacillus thermoglucosidasius]